jgi:hypothetical protein
MLAHSWVPWRGVLRGTCFHDMVLPPSSTAINPHTPAVQLKKFYRTCSALDVFLKASLVGLSTSDRILTSYERDLCQKAPLGARPTLRQREAFFLLSVSDSYK